LAHVPDGDGLRLQQARDGDDAKLIGICRSAAAAI
jgi:hypothetical protein